MKCPKSVRVIGKDYDIFFYKKLKDAGYCYNVRQLIKVEKGQAPEAERDTVLHEVIHAIDYAMQCGLKEKQVHRLAGGLIQVLRENPAFAAYLVRT